MSSDCEHTLLDGRKLGKYTDNMVGMDVSIYDGELHVECCTEASDGGSSYSEATIPINFCPVCGVKIGQEVSKTISEVCKHSYLLYVVTFANNCNLSFGEAISHPNLVSEEAFYKQLEEKHNGSAKQTMKGELI